MLHGPKKKEIEFVASDTDVFAIYLLNHEHFSQKQVILHHGDVRRKIDMSKLVKDMNEDGDTNLARLRGNGVNSPTVFGLIHPLIGSDILCSPRGFGPSWVLKTCLDYGTYLFHPEHGIQHLGQEDESGKGAYVRFILGLFKKKYSGKIKATPAELLAPLDDYTERVSEVQKQTWAHTIETKSMLPSQECLQLREKNLAFQLKIWMNATSPTLIIPDPKMHGWEEVDGEYQLKADSDENQEKHRTIFDHIMRKCGCKSSQCLSNRCSCKKNGSLCSSLCECMNCENHADAAKRNANSKSAPAQIELTEEEEQADQLTSASESESEHDESDKDDSDIDF